MLPARCGLQLSPRANPSMPPAKHRPLLHVRHLLLFCPPLGVPRPLHSSVPLLVLHRPHAQAELGLAPCPEGAGLRPLPTAAPR